MKPKQRSTINKTDAMKEDLDEEVQGEEVEPNQGWSLVFETHVFFLYCSKRPFKLVCFVFPFHVRVAENCFFQMSSYACASTCICMHN